MEMLHKGSVLPHRRFILMLSRPLESKARLNVGGYESPARF